METKIESAYDQDEKFAKEYFSYHSYKRPSGIIITVICVLAIVSGIVYFLANNEYLAILAVVLGIYLFILRMIRVKKSIKISLERGKESNHGNFVSVETLVTENSIIVKSSTNQSGTEYDIACIDKAYRSKNYIYLITKAKWAIVFDINNFSKGTPEELIAFMRQKGIKIK